MNRGPESATFATGLFLRGTFSKAVGRRSAACCGDDSLEAITGRYPAFALACEVARGGSQRAADALAVAGTFRVRNWARVSDD